MDSDLDTILRRVAAGELTPEAALPLIDAAQAASGSAPHWGSPPSTGDLTGEPPYRGPDVTGEVGDEEGPAGGVRIAASYRSLDVIADPTVEQIVVTGPHGVRREGATLVVESLQLPVFGAGGERFSFTNLPRSLAWARSVKEEHVTVRINPRLPVELDVAATGARVSGLEGGVRIRLVAASLKVDRLRGPLEIDAMSSSVRGTAAITGSSRIVCESSSVRLGLLAGTDVRVRATNRLSKVVLGKRVAKGGFADGEVTEAVFGSGGGDLTVEAVMSSLVLADDAGLLHRASA